MKKSIVFLSLIAATAVFISGCGQHASGSDGSAKDAGYSEFAGDWEYQVMDPDNTENFTPNGDVAIMDDGSYTYTSPGGDKSNGSARIEYEEYSDGTKLPMLNFYAADDSFWIGTYYDESDPDTLWIGNGGEERLVRSGK